MVSITLVLVHSVLCATIFTHIYMLRFVVSKLYSTSDDNGVHRNDSLLFVLVSFSWKYQECFAVFKKSLHTL